MKTFSDPQTTIQQEQARVATFKKRVEILWQYAGKILARDSATVIVVTGDATARFSVADTLVIPLAGFETNHVITAISYDSGDDETTITCADSSFAATGLPGLHIARRYTVSGGDYERLIEMTPIEFQNEGETLNAFESANVDFGFDNGDGFFANSNGTGLFDNTDIHWVRVYGGWRYASDRVLLFGGIIMRQFTKDDRYKKYFKITAFGHITELERYPAYLLSEPNGDFLRINGFEIVGVEGNSKTFAGPKKLQFDFKSKGLPGVEILSISKSKNSGIVPLKFRYPNLFKYAYGDWTEVAEGTASATLVGSDESELSIKTTNYDVQDREVFLQIVNELNARVQKTGEVEVVFDNGAPAKIATDWDAVVIQFSGTYYDLTKFNDREGWTFETLSDANSEIYLFSKEPFYGFSAIFADTDLVGTIALSFSNGLNSWQSIVSPTDSTSNFTQDGEITWNQADVQGWRPITFEQVPSQVFTQKYAVRIDLSAYTSGSATLKILRRYYRAFANDGTALSFRLNFYELAVESTKEDVILREIEGIWTACTWYRNISIQRVIEMILSAAQYSAGSYTLDDLKLSFNTARINIIGQAPAPFYQKKCKALLWDSGNEKLYLGIGDELWSVTETGEFIFLDQLDKINENATGYGIVELSIRNLALDSGEIHGMAWWDKYDDGIIHEADFYSSFYTWFFKSDGNAIIEVLAASGQEQTNAPQYIHPCEMTMRKGEPVGGVSIGIITEGLIEHGENIIIPFPQILRNYDDLLIAQQWFGKETLLTDEKTTAALYNFGSDYETPQDVFYLSSFDHGHIKGSAEVGDTGWIALKWQLGQQGLCQYSAGNGFIVYKMQRTESTKTDTNARLGKISVDQAFTSIYDFADSSYQPLCSFIYSGALYLAFMLWDDTVAIPSKCFLASINLTTGVKTDLFDFSTDSAEAAQSITGYEANCTVLEMQRNAEENTIHGCILNRNNFEYHWFVYDIANDKLYSTQNGSNFTFDKHRQCKDFVYLNEKIYAVCVDKRYQTDAVFLVEASFSAGTITLNRIDTIDESWDHLCMIATAEALFGVTGNGKLWKYGTEYYPRIGQANFGRKNMREVLTECCQVLNRVVNFRADRTVRIVERSNYDGSKTLYEDTHIVQMEPIENWKHYYDRVNVQWSDPVTGTAGTESYGTEGWENLELNLNNSLIQDRHLAAAVAESYHTFFNVARKVVTGKLIAMIELEEYDRVKFILKKSRTDIARADYYNLIRVSFDPDQLLVEFEALS